MEKVSNDQSLEKAVHRRAAHLKAVATGVIFGLMAGVGLFIATNWLVMKGGEDPGAHLALLGQYFIGYSITFLGSIVGFLYAAIVGFVGAYLVARIYNWIVDLKLGR